MLDLAYEEDVAADVDLNVVMTAKDAMVEIQGTAEKAPFSRAQLDDLVNLAAGGIQELVKAQQAALQKDS